MSFLRMQSFFKMYLIDLHIIGSGSRPDKMNPYFNIRHNDSSFILIGVKTPFKG